MIDPIERAALLALYQISIALGIVILPVAILARQGGITIPIHRPIDRLRQAYEDASPAEA